MPDNNRVMVNSILPFLQVIDLPYQDGTAPSPEVINDWLELLQSKRTKQLAEQEAGDCNSEPVCVAIHCVAGLGRAPVLVAVALIENGMKSLEAVELIRSKRRGAINQTQLDFLTNYKSKKRLKAKKKFRFC